MDPAQLELKLFSMAGDGLTGAGLAEDCARLLWIRSGSGNATFGQHSQVFRPYTLVAIGRQAVRLQAEACISGYSLEVGADFLASSFLGTTLPMLDEFLDLLRHNVVVIHFSQQARCEAEWLIQRMLREDRNSPEFFRAAIRLTLGQFLLLSYKQWLKKEQGRETVSAGAESVVNLLRDHIDEHLNEDFGLKQLSLRAGYAPSYLSSLFSRVNGQGLTEYISRKRIVGAQSLLRNSSLKIVEICYRVGFKDLAHFNRTFKRFVGATPNQYRQSNEHGMLPTEAAPYPKTESRGTQAARQNDPPYSRVMSIELAGTERKAVLSI
jgi:AraC-like DNA-binding protein